MDYLLNYRAPIEERLEEQRRIKADEEMIGVTFTPEINTKSIIMTQSIKNESVVNRTQNWQNSKLEKHKKEIEKVTQQREEEEMKESRSHVKDFEPREETKSKVQHLTSSVDNLDTTNSVIYYNRGNYRNDVESRVQRKLRNFGVRKEFETQKTQNMTQQTNVDLTDFKIALHKKINSN